MKAKHNIPTPQQVQQRAARYGFDQYRSEPMQIPHPRAHVLRGDSERRDEPHIDGDEFKHATGVVVPLTWHLDERGALAELLRDSWLEDYAVKHRSTGQAYLSTTMPGVVKAWHLHAIQMDRFICVRGRVVVGLCCLFTGDTRRIVLEPCRSLRTLHIPPGVAHGWKALGNEEAWVLNLCSHEYDGTDEYRRPAHDGPRPDIAFDWNAKVDG